MSADVQLTREYSDGYCVCVSVDRYLLLIDGTTSEE